MAIDDQAYKDALKAIEAGDIPEDLDLPDPEEYDDMGGIKSLDRDAPSIKMASEPGDDEAVIEIGQMLEAYEDAVKNGYEGDIKEFSEYYFSQMKMDKERTMAMYGGSMRAQYAMGTPESSEIKALLEGLKPYKALLEGLKPYADQKEIAKKMKLKELMPEFEKDAKLLPMKKKYNFIDLIDTKAEDEYYKTKEELLDRKYNAKNYPPSQRGMSMEELKKMFKKAEEDKLKRAKGGIAGVL